MLWAEIALADRVTASIAALGAVLALSLAIVVFRARKGARLNQNVARLLVVEAALAATIVVTTLPIGEESFRWSLLVAALLCADGAVTVLFASSLHPPWARKVASPVGVAVVIAFATALLAATAWAAIRKSGGGPISASDPVFSFAWFWLGVASLYALVVAIHDFRMTREGTAAHRRARAFAIAFAARNASVFGGVMAWGVTDALGLFGVRAWTEAFSVTGSVLLAILLAYGILATQLFDIELKLKLGIKRGTLAAILVGGFFAVYKVAEFYLGREFGYALGGILSGFFFFLAPRLNKFADGVASKAVPKAEATPDYIAFKKLEVYKAAVETAFEDGVVDPKERAFLDTLRRKLALKSSDADAIEAEFHETRPASPDAAATV